MLSHLAMLALSTVVAVTSTETLAPAPGPRHQLVRDGQAVATIVLPAKADKLEVYAAAELQSYVKSITATTLSIIHEPSKPNGYPIWLGQTSVAGAAGFDLSKAKLGRDGYAAKADGKGLIVVGRCPLGTLFGVYDIIECEFGVRWIVPDERHEILKQGWLVKDGKRTWDRRCVWVDSEMFGTVIPKSAAVSVGTFGREFKPSFEYRWVREGNWSLHNRMNTKTMLADGTPVGVNMKWHFHTFGTLIPPAKYFKDHPEWFALVKGKRHNYTDPENLGHDSQLCTTNPEVIEKLAKGMIEVLRADPTIEIISLAPNDGAGFCQCDKCKSLDEPERDTTAEFGFNFSRWTNRINVLNNAVAKLVGKEFPDVKIKVGSYGFYYLPPVQNIDDYQPNLLVQICRSMDQFRPLTSPEPHYHRDIVKQWRAITDQLFVYEYYATADWGKYRALRPQVYLMREDIPWYRDLGIKGFYTQNVQQPWYHCPLNHYIAAKLAWNADLEVDWLVDDFCDKFFEDASGPMQDYLLGLEQAMLDFYNSDASKVRGLGTAGKASRIFNKTVRSQLRGHLEQADKTTKSETVKRRIAAVRRGLDEFEDSLSGLVELNKWRKRKAEIRKEIAAMEEAGKLPELKKLKDELAKGKAKWNMPAVPDVRGQVIEED